MWEDGISPWGNTPHCAKAQRFYPSAVVDVGDGVPGKEQVDCEREKVEEGEKQERETNTKRRTTNGRSNAHHGWHRERRLDAADTPRPMSMSQKQCHNIQNYLMQTPYTCSSPHSTFFFQFNCQVTTHKKEGQSITADENFPQTFSCYSDRYCTIHPACRNSSHPRMLSFTFFSFLGPFSNPSSRYSKETPFFT